MTIPLAPMPPPSRTAVRPAGHRSAKLPTTVIIGMTVCLDYRSRILTLLSDGGTKVMTGRAKIRLAFIVGIVQTPCVLVWLRHLLPLHQVFQQEIHWSSISPLAPLCRLLV